jgi:hypothetical protein
MGKRRPPDKRTAYREGQVFCPVHEFNLYKVIRASTELPPGAKVTWEALVERTFRPHVYVDCAYETLGLDIGLKRDQTKKYVRMLIRARMLRVTPRFKDGHQKSNHIEFIWRDPEIIQQGRMGFGARKRGGARARAAANV